MIELKAAIHSLCGVTMPGGTEKPTTISQKLAARFGNPLEWSFVDRTLLWTGIYVGLLVAMSIIVAFGGVQTGVVGWESPLGPDSLHRTTAITFLLATAVASVIFLIGLRLRRQRPQARWPAYLLALFLVAFSGWWLAWIGHSTNPATFMIIFLHGFLGFLFFDRIFCWLILTSWVIFLGVWMTLEQLGLISYAPLANLIPGMTFTIHPIWLIMCWSFGAILIGSMLLLTGYVVQRWRKREAQVVELSDVLKKMFGRYLSTEVMNTLLENPSAMELGGQRRRVTIMMTDLRGFTALSERLSPEKVVQLLNSYFEVMVDLVLKYNGTINEIIGDALLVVFGAPQKMDNRAQQALACAIEMQNAMSEVNRKNRDEGLPELEMGIALNDTEVIVGNVGSSKRSSYSVVGSGVNLTSRIESYSIGGQILVSESIRKELGALVRIDGQRKVMPKGAGKPLAIYEVGGIAAPYHMSLMEREPELVALNKPIPVRGVVLEGKHLGSGEFRGRIDRLSTKACHLRSDLTLEAFNNLKFNLDQVDPALAGHDFYGKVVSHDENSGGAVLIRFTALPPGIDGFFQAAMVHGSSK